MNKRKATNLIPWMLALLIPTVLNKLPNDLQPKAKPRLHEIWMA